MLTSLQRYVVTETGLSMVINTVLSAAFTALIFGGRDLVAPAGAVGYAADFIVQSFIVILMSVAAPSLITRARQAKGKAPVIASGLTPLSRIWLRAFAAAAAGAVVLGGGLMALSALAGPIPFGALLAVKSLYGAGLAALATPWALRAVLAKRAPTSA